MESQTENAGGAWPSLAPDVLPYLGVEDDPALWEAAIDVIFRDAEFLCGQQGRRDVVVAQLGACSHWLRPHQTRWTADGGFAWPTGYGGTGFSRLGLPEFDWLITRRWDHFSSSWRPEGDGLRTGRLVFRVALPTRTARHMQAAVHTLWTPGTPIFPRRELPQFYGFRKKEGCWLCTAYRGKDSLYERTDRESS
jgi:hypothetical protein